MTITIHLEGSTEKIGIYNLDRLELEGIDNGNYDLEDREDLERYLEDVDALVESGELDALESAEVVSVLDPENLQEILLGDGSREEEALEIDAITLQNIPADRFLHLIEEAEPGEILYLRNERGEGFWDFSAEVEDEEADPSKISMGYVECSLELDTYDLLRETYYDRLCDTFLPTELRYDETPFNRDRLLFNPSFISGTLYKVVRDPETGTKVLERLPVPTRIFLDESEEI